MELNYESEEGKHIRIVLPDKFIVKDMFKFAEGTSNAPENSPLGVRNFFGAIALCEKIEGIDLDNPLDEELDIWGWFQAEVYDRYVAATTPKKKT